MQDKALQLSSKWTDVGLYGGSLVALLMVPTLYIQVQKEGFHNGVILAGIMVSALMAFMTYQFLFVCSAHVVEDQLILKKKFRPAKSYAFDRIGKVTSFQLKKTKYITVWMRNDDGSNDKYLIVNSKSLLSFENKDAKEALIGLRDMAQNNLY